VRARRPSVFNETVNNARESAGETQINEYITERRALGMYVSKLSGGNQSVLIFEGESKVAEVLNPFTAALIKAFISC
jgi:hypothetical protein